MASQTLTDLCESVKGLHVGKSGNPEPEEIEKLPNDKLKECWNNGTFGEFLKEFQCIIPALASGISRKSKDEINATLPFLPELGSYPDGFDHDIHSVIFECYSKLIKLCSCCDVDSEAAELQKSLRKNLARSVNRYVDNILRIQTICPNIGTLVKFLSKNCQEQTLKVEEELRLKFQKDSVLADSRYPECTCVLQLIALQFQEKLYIYPLVGEFPQKPGVYFIYHVGKNQLYEGSQYFPSTRRPVYVGMSTTSIRKRLETHRKNIASATADKHTETSGQTDKEQTEGEEKTEETEQSDGEQSDEEQTDEKQTEQEQTEEEQRETRTQTESVVKQTEAVKMKLTDFFVRFMIVDPGHYACSIEKMLIEYLRPVWNSETVKLSFGNASSDNNKWRKYHITEDPGTIAEISDCLKNLAL